MAVADLTAGERAQMPAGGRRHDWLLGRAAVKLLLGGGDLDQRAVRALPQWLGLHGGQGGVDGQGHVASPPHGLC